LALMCALLIPAGCAPAAQLTPIPSSAERSITVLGQGRVAVAPDVARASIGVETSAPTVAEATRQNAERMAAVVAWLKQMGVAERDIQTAGYSIDRGPQEPGVTLAGGYRASNMVRVTIRDLSRVGSILDGVVQAGANQVFGVAFGLDEPAAAVAQVRATAVADARARAEDLARLANLSLGPVLALSEGATGPQPVAEAAGGAGGAVEPPISPGETEVSVQVQVTYAIQ